MVKIDIKSLRNKAKKEVESAGDLKKLNQIFRKYLGRGSGEVTKVLRSLKDMPKIKKAKIGKGANELKTFLESIIDQKRADLVEKDSVDKGGWFDISVPGKKPRVGHLHPLTQVKREIMYIFQGIGFDVIEGPELENEHYNFDALNIPKDHPARDAWDTFWIKRKKANQEKLLLRTHTSPVQARYMESHKPPLRVIAPGKVFRHEATDASHEMQFYQIEGLMVDKDISVPHFKAVIKEFLSRFFEKEVNIRLRPDFFPFTEPSFEISISCLNCKGKGCPACKRTGWMEMAGAGMVHPNVFRACNLDPKAWQGWAFGFGWDRLTMQKYKIDDIRLLNSGDLRFVKQF